MILNKKAQLGSILRSRLVSFIIFIPIFIAIGVVAIRLIALALS